MSKLATAVAEQAAKDGRTGPPWGLPVASALADVDAARMRVKVQESELTSRHARIREAQAVAIKRSRALMQRLIQSVET